MILNVGAGGKEGNQVNITPTLTQGIKIADYSIDDVSGELYAPQGGGSGNTTSRELTPAEYAALSDEEKNNGTVYYVNDGGSSENASSNGINYSTEEQNTGLTWIDGKEIYQKTVIVNRANFDNTWTEIPHNIENIDNICDYDVLIKAPDQGVDYWYILSDRGSNTAAATYISKVNIGIINTWLSGSSTWYFTIKYTKLIETIN